MTDLRVTEKLLKAHCLKMIFALSNEMVKDALYNEFGVDDETRNRIEKVFEEGAAKLKRHLGTVIGDQAKADRILDYIENRTVPDASAPPQP